jgi:uncharacterized protein (DUF58 family)
MGYLFSGEIERVAGQIAAFGGRLMLLLSAGLAGYILYKYAARRRFLRQLRIARISVEDLKQKLERGENPVIVDLRDAYEFEAEPETIPGALRADPSELGERGDQLPSGKEVILYCT